MLTLLTIPYVASKNFLLESVSFFKMKEREAGLVLSKVVKQQMKVKQIVENFHFLSIKVRVAFLKSR